MMFENNAVGPAVHQLPTTSSDRPQRGGRPVIVDSQGWGSEQDRLWEYKDLIFGENEASIAASEHGVRSMS